VVFLFEAIFYFSVLSHLNIKGGMKNNYTALRATTFTTVEDSSNYGGT
jgi:hypothetical protein